MTDHVTTTHGLAVLEAELAELEGDGRRKIAERIKVAREWGDLKENSEYHDAKNEQAHLETRIARLREKLSGITVVDSPPSPDIVGFGSTVVVRSEDGQEQTWQLVSSHEAQPREGRLSFDSPIARALVGRRPGENVSVPVPSGQRRLVVVRIG